MPACRPRCRFIIEYIVKKTAMEHKDNLLLIACEKLIKKRKNIERNFEMGKELLGSDRKIAPGKMAI